MIIWSGLGFLPVVFLIVFGFVFADANGHSSDKTFIYAVLSTGVVCGLLGWWLWKRPARVLVDKATGKEVAFRPSHSLFFIPVIFWCPIFFAFALYMAFAQH